MSPEKDYDKQCPECDAGLLHWTIHDEAAECDVCGHEKRVCDIISEYYDSWEPDDESPYDL